MRLVSVVVAAALAAASPGPAPWTSLAPTSTPHIFFPGTVSRKGIVPEPLAIADEPAGGKGYPTLAADGTLYFSSMPEGTRDSDIYRASPSGGGYAAPKRLPSPVNTDRFEGDAYVDRQERFVIFAAFDREGGLGESDLHISFRCGTEWTEPANLGPEVNSSGFDGSPWVTPDDHVLLFTSSRPTDESGEPDFFNVYSVSLDLETLAPPCTRE